MNQSVGQILIAWYELHKRDLPWRNTKDPYIIWISEIVLQQTRVAQGTPYFYKLTENFPTIFHLANATEQEVLKNWEGLGYYSRARNMHFTAKYIVSEFEGIFPKSHDEILKLKGIGKYTAAAIASFAFNEPVAVLDGNVMRVLTRLYDIHGDISEVKVQDALRNLANQLIINHNPAIFNQAIMEFGSLQCTPANPACDSCVCNEICASNSNKTQLVLPVKNKKTKIRTRFFNYLVIFTNKNEVWMNQRSIGDIWEGLNEFYLIESQIQIESFEELKINPDLKSEIKFERLFKEKKHVLSHQNIYATFWICHEKDHANQRFLLDNNLNKLILNQQIEMPVSKLIKNFFEKQLK